MSGYLLNNLTPNRDLFDAIAAFQIMSENDSNFLATRVSYKLNLQGPSINVQTACSTSLVAISQAIDSLRAGRCSMALAGGIAVTCPVRSGHVYQEGGMLSADGHTRSFDADASGTVFSDGAAVVLLKRQVVRPAPGCAGVITPASTRSLTHSGARQQARARSSSVSMDSSISSPIWAGIWKAWGMVRLLV